MNALIASTYRFTLVEDRKRAGLFICAPQNVCETFFGDMEQYIRMRETDVPIEDLLRDFRSNRAQEKSFRTIFNTYYPQVWRFFIRRGIAAEDARELAQDVFFSVYRGLAGIQDEAHFTTWLFTIARNALLNEFERRHAKKRSGLQVVIQNDEGDQNMDVLASTNMPDSLQSMLNQEKMEKLAAALEELPPQMRRCVHLRIVSGSSYDEIATVMGISINTVKAHLFKSRKALQQKLSSYFGDFGNLDAENG